MPADPHEMTHASVRIQRRVEWVDTDASTKWHNTAALRMLEAAETTLLDRLGLLDVIYGRLPRVSMTVRFRRALRFRQKVDISLEVAALGRTSITYRGGISHDGETAVTGELVAVLVDDSGNPSEWSDDQRKLLASSGPQTPELLAEGQEKRSSRRSRAVSEAGLAGREARSPSGDRDGGQQA